MSEPIKLRNAGDRHTMTVARCRLLPFGNDPEVEYEGRDGSKVWMPEDSSDRQLARLNLTRESVVGCTITIKRDANKVKGRPPFWGIYLEDSGAENGTGGASNDAAAGAPTVGKAVEPAPHQPTAQSPAEKLTARYEQATAFVLKRIVPMYAGAGLEPTANDVHAMVSTLFIALNGKKP